MKRTKLMFRFMTGLVLILSILLSSSATLAQGNAISNQSVRPTLPLATGDELWASNFALGTSDDVDAVAMNGNDLYLGGDFTSAGGISANHIVHYNTATHRWSALGSGVNNRVYSIVSNGRYVYVGGDFSTAGGVIIAELAVFDNNTQTWSKVGNATLVHAITSPSIHALAFDSQGSLIVGGQFDSIGGLVTPNIAKWNGTSWSKMGSGLGNTNSEVDSLAVSGTDIYAGGTFTSPLGAVAHWNGASWTSLGSGVSQSFYQNVDAIAISGNNVYIGGSFDTVTDSNGNHAVNNIAVWDGNFWHALGTGIDAGVYTMGVDGSGNLYAAGQYNTAGGITVNKIAVWNGSIWAALKSPSSLNAGADTNIYSLVVSGNDVFVGGALTTAGDWRVNHAARWNSVAQNWYSLGGGTDTVVNAVAVKGDNVFVGGNFETAGGVITPAIARWNGISHTWNSLGTGLAGCEGFLCSYPSVDAILVVGNDIYVGGNFYTAGGVVAHDIARWNLIDQNWHAMGSGLSCTGLFCAPLALSMVYNGTCVVIGGSFSGAGIVSANNLAQWCGSSWSNVVWNDGTDHIIGPDNQVYALAYDPSLAALYVGGAFTTPVADAFWMDYRDGPFPIASDSLNGAVNAIALLGSDIYIGGSFTNVGPGSANHVAAQIGSNTHWSALGSSFDAAVHALSFQGNSLVAGGDFLNSGAIGVSHVARFNGVTWSPIGSGTDGSIYGLATDSNFVYVGGSFQKAGNKPATNFSLWGEYHLNLPVIRK